MILVTGCGSGIGLALAEILYTQFQYRVVITARDTSLPMLFSKFRQGERFMIRGLDVTSESQRQDIMNQITVIWGGVDILINNAGISYRSAVEHMTEDDEQKQMAVNYLGPVGLIRLALPYMREKGRGKIINVSSVSGMLAMPTMASYSASKHALEGFSEALWYEMKPLGINVSLIQPGFIHSNSFMKVYFTKYSDPASSTNGPYCDYYANMAPFIERLMAKSMTTPKDVALRILKVIQKEQPRLWIPATIDAWIFYYMRRLLPRHILLPVLFAALPKSRSWGREYTKKRKAA